MITLNIMYKNKWALMGSLLIFIFSILLFSDYTVKAKTNAVTYYVSVSGSDNCSGVTNQAFISGTSCAFRTAGKALSIVKPGDTIAILPGVYRETLTPTVSGEEGNPITIKAENGPNTVFFYASESSQGKVWKNYSEYTKEGKNLDLQAGVDPNNIKYIDLDWCFTEENGGVNRIFYDNCSSVPSSKIAVPFETDIIALLEPRGDSSGNVVRLPKAKEPDWRVDTSWKRSENWWKADSAASSLDDGSAVAQTTGRYFLKDTLDDHNLDEDLDGKYDFPNIQPGNIQSFFDQDDFIDPRDKKAPSPGDFTEKYADVSKKNSLGATIIFNDGSFGHYTDNLFIKDYNAATGIIELQDSREDTSGEDILSYVTKFYIEGTPKAMDCPGEWVHHDGKLFVLTGQGCEKAITEDNLQNLEIAKYFELLKIDSVSNVVIKDLNFSFGNTNRTGFDLYKPWHEGLPRHLHIPPKLISVTSEPSQNLGYSKNIVFDGITVEHSMTGMMVVGSSKASEDKPSSLTLTNSRIENIDDLAFRFMNYFSDDTPTSFGVFQPLIIENNTFSNLGFRPITGMGAGLQLVQVSNVVFRNNTVQNIGHNGVEFLQGWDKFYADNILVENNIFESACLMATDCGGLKFHGGGKTFGNVLVFDNISRNNIGWTYAKWRRDLRDSHPKVGEEHWFRHNILGVMGRGYYLDYASGVTFYKNYAVKNGEIGFSFNQNFRDGKVHIFDNIVYSSLDGVRFNQWVDEDLNISKKDLQSIDTYKGHPLYNTDTKIMGNIFTRTENTGVRLVCSAKDVREDDAQDVPYKWSSINVEIDNNIYKKYQTSVNPKPYWLDDSDYHPSNLEYLCFKINSLQEYSPISVVQDKTSWEDNGRDLVESDSLFVNEGGNNKDDYKLIDQQLADTLGWNTVRSEVAGLIVALESELGVNIDIKNQSGEQISIPVTSPNLPILSQLELQDNPANQKPWRSALQVGGIVLGLGALIFWGRKLVRKLRRKKNQGNKPHINQTNQQQEKH